MSGASCWAGSSFILGSWVSEVNELAVRPTGRVGLGKLSVRDRSPGLRNEGERGVEIDTDEADDTLSLPSCSPLDTLLLLLLLLWLRELVASYSDKPSALLPPLSELSLRCNCDRAPGDADGDTSGASRLTLHSASACAGVNVVTPSDSSLRCSSWR